MRKNDGRSAAGWAWRCVVTPAGLQPLSGRQDDSGHGLRRKRWHLAFWRRMCAF